jgi:hypothetical protein
VGIDSVVVRAMNPSAHATRQRFRASLAQAIVTVKIAAWESLVGGAGTMPRERGLEGDLQCFTATAVDVRPQ